MTRDELVQALIARLAQKGFRATESERDRSSYYHITICLTAGDPAMTRVYEMTMSGCSFHSDGVLGRHPKSTIEYKRAVSRRWVGIHVGNREADELAVHIARSLMDDFAAWRDEQIYRASQCARWDIEKEQKEQDELQAQMLIRWLLDELSGFGFRSVVAPTVDELLKLTLSTLLWLREVLV